MKLPHVIRVSGSYNKLSAPGFIEVKLKIPSKHLVGDQLMSEVIHTGSTPP